MKDSSNINSAAGARASSCLQLTVPCTAVQVSRARGLVARFLGASPDPLACLILVTELAANSVVHSAASPGAAMTITVTWFDDGSVRIACADGGGLTVPVLRRDGRDPLETAGRGLQIVSELSGRWGYQTEPDGSLITWCEVPASVLRSACERADCTVQAG